VLHAEYERSVQNCYRQERITTQDNTRFCRWAGQTDDGRKWSSSRADIKEIFPWRGASDTRIPLADSICNDLVDLEVTAWARSVLRCGPTELNDVSAATTASTLMRWVQQQMAGEIEAEVELLSQWRHHYGLSIAFVGWCQESGTRVQAITMDDLAGISQQAPAGSLAAELPALVANPEAEDQAAELWVAQVGIEKREALRIVRELRETGRATMQVPIILKNRPVVLALKPWEDIVFPPETVRLQDARVIFRREMLNEVQVRQRVTDMGWDEGWVDEVCQHSGRMTPAIQPTTVTGEFSEVDSTQNLLEVVWAYARQLRDDGLTQITCTVFSPAVKDKFAFHEPLGYAHGKYPFVEFKREHAARRLIDSRGVPEICATWQHEVKVQRDAVADITSLTTVPPLLVSKRLGFVSRLGPAVQVQVTRQDDLAFMQPPARQPATAWELVQDVRLQADDYFGRANTGIPPVKTQLKQQRMINQWLAAWREVFDQAFVLAIQFISADEISRITGSPDVESLDPQNARYDFHLSFNVAEMDSDLTMKRLETISTAVVPLDAAGVIDRSKLVRMILQAIAPESAEELVTDVQGASQQIYNGVKSEIQGMMLGFEANYTDASNDPTAPMKMQFAQQLLQSNPAAQQAAQSNPAFQQLLQKYIQNLQMGVMQQQNKQIGRIGVAPREAAPVEPSPEEAPSQ